MYLIDKDKELNPLILGQVIQSFKTKELPTLINYWNYYKGKQAITKKVASDTGKPCFKVITNYAKSIVDNYRGYLTGIDIAYTAENNFEPIQDVLNYNDIHTADSELLKDALIFGVGYEISYLDEFAKSCFKKLDPRTVIPIYDNTLSQNLLYVVRFYLEDTIDEDKYIVEVYDANTVKTYRSTMGFTSFNLIDEKPHYFGMVPVTVFSLNEEQESIFAQIISLQDAYNELLSDEVDSFQAFSDAYLVLKGVHAEPEDLTAMKESRVLEMDSDATAEYLTKSITDTQIEDMLGRVSDNIHKIANSPDFSQESFGVSSGIALRFRLLGFENAAAGIEANMKKALQKRIELICAILNLKGGDSIWRDVHIQFTRNLPVNIAEVANTVNSLRGVVSSKTLISLLPFVPDAQAELDALNEEKEANMAMYSFPTGEIEEQDKDDKEKADINE